MKLNRNEKYVKWGLTAFLVIVAAGLFWLVFSNLRGFYDLIVEFLNIIAALLYGCLFAYLMNPVMKVTQRIMGKLLAKRNLSEPDELGLQRCDGHLQYPAWHRRGRVYPDL